MSLVGRVSKEDLPSLLTEAGNRIPIYELLEVNADHVDGLLCEQTEWQALVAYQHGRAKLDVERADNNVEEVEAMVFAEIMSKEGKRPPMEAMRHYVALDKRVKSAKSKLLVAKERESALDSIRWALQTRRDMIVQLNADIRAEKKLQ
jgi:hypothetical protein